MNSENRERIRRRFLQTLYERNDGNEEVFDSVAEISGELQLNEEEANKIAQYLESDGLVVLESETSELIRITHSGVVEVEGIERSARSDLLKWIYDKSRGDERKYFQNSVIDKALGLHPKITKRIVQFLKGEGLLKKVAPRTIAITHEGIRKVEDESLGQDEGSHRTVGSMSNFGRQPQEVIPDSAQANIMTAWNAVRSLLQNKTFYDIKDIAGLAGADLTQLSQLVQRPVGGASKGELMTAIDGIFGKMNSAERDRFLRITTEELLSSKPDLEKQLHGYLTRLGWTLYEGKIIPVELLDISELPELPRAAQDDLVKASERLRDGDLSGAVSAACGAVDSVTAEVYTKKGLGDLGKASFQEKVNKSLKALDVFSKMESELTSIGWQQQELSLFKENLRKSLNHAAYVMQTLRSNMGDVHGTKPALRALVFNSIKWATLIVRMLKDTE